MIDKSLINQLARGMTWAKHVNEATITKLKAAEIRAAKKASMEP